MSPTSPFVAPVNVDFAPTKVYAIDDDTTLGYLLENLILGRQAFFCKPVGSGWSLFIGAYVPPSQPKETPVDTPDHVR